MPYFSLDCTERILVLKDPKVVLKEVLETAYSTGSFEKKNIKDRMDPFKYCLVREGENDFIHFFGNIMQGRTDEQKVNSPKMIAEKLKELFTELPIISINIRDFEKEFLL
jgi:5-carboxymethyl-2-hydroxymuconate isomerase